MSKVRVIYNCDGTVYTNRQAYQMVESFAADYVLRKPAAFKTWPRWKRAKWLNDQMPHGYKFMVFREPRNLRMSRSLFASEVLKAGGVLPEKKKKLKMRNGNRIEYIPNVVADELNRIVWGEPAQAVQAQPARPADRIRFVRRENLGR